MNDIKVSIICNVYNHEKYIRDALESFVMQKTNFEFEVLVHDDASTDKTADIIREFEEEYPNIIKPIYQIENQYSKNIPIGSTYQKPRVKGKYVAICEGDDYWTDPYKLQKQFDAMEMHPELDVCSHMAKVVESNSKDIIRHIRPAKKSKIIRAEQVIDGGGGFVATNSLFYRTEIDKNIPEFRKYLPLDFSLQIHSSLRGGMLYLDECMSAYRYMTTGSWSSQMETNSGKSIEHEKRIVRMLEILNEETKYKYNKILNKKILRNKSETIYKKVLIKRDLERSDYDVIKRTTLKWKARILLQLKFPELMNNLKQAKRNIWK